MSLPLLEPIWWNWLLLGLVLMGLELLVSGVFLLWLGIGALLTGLLTMATGSPHWAIQVVFFCFFSLISVSIGRSLNKRKKPAHDTLNRRLQQYLGRQATLAEPIVNGTGRIKLNDTYWTVRGKDMPAGSSVLIVGVQASAFIVEKTTGNPEK